MAFGYTAQELIKEIRDLSGINNTSSDGATDTDVLGHINAAMRELILPVLHNCREDYNLVRERVSVSASGETRLPVRAMWNKLSNAWLWDGERRKYLTPVRTEELADYALTGTTEPSGVYVEGNHVQLLPAGACTLEMAYFFRPGDLMKTTSARQILSVDVSTGEVIFSTAIPTAWEALPSMDIHSQYSGAEIKAWDVTPTAAAGTSVTFSPTAINGSVFGRKTLATGDWVCLAEEAVLPAVPRELHPLIVRAVALRYAEAEGDSTMARTHAELLDRMMKTAQTTLEQRVELKPMRLTPNRSTLAAARDRSYRRW